MIIIATLNIILAIAFALGGYYYGFAKGLESGRLQESAKYVDKVKVVTKETVE